MVDQTTPNTTTATPAPAPVGSVIDLLSGFDDIRSNHPDVIAANLQAVKTIMATATPADIAAAKADNVTYSTSGIAGPGLGGLMAPGLPYGGADNYGWAVNGIATTDSTTAKNHFNYPRPFIADPTIHALVGAGSGSFPSGHTSKGFAESLYLAYVFPERFQQILTRASEYGLHRIMLGVHYPLDIVAGRMVGEWDVAHLLDPATNATGGSATMNAAVAVRRAMIGAIGPGKTIAQRAASGAPDRFSDLSADEAAYEGRLTFGLPSVGETDLPMGVPPEAPYLLATRFPYLDLDQIAEILRTTALPSGVVLDNGNGWARLDLFKAAGGYGALASDTTVTMDAAAAQDDSRPGAGFNAADTWSNDISGAGILTKQGSGVLTLSGTDTFGGIALEAGGIVLTGADAFSGSLQADGGTLTASGSRIATTGDLSIGSAATLVLGPTELAVDGTLDADGAVQLLAAATLDLQQASSISGTIAGAGSLSLSGPGALALSGANSYAGGTGLSSGALLLGDDAALGTGALARGDGTTLGFTAAALDLANAIAVAGTATLDVEAAQGTETLSGTLSDGPAPGLLDKTGAGTLVLSGANRYAGGTLIGAGTLELGGMGAAGTGAIAFGPGGGETLRLDAAGTLAAPVTGFAAGDALDLAGLLAAGATAAFDGTTLTVSGQAADGTGPASVALAVSAPPAGDGFRLSADAAGGTLVTLAALPAPAPAPSGATPAPATPSKREWP